MTNGIEPITALCPDACDAWFDTDVAALFQWCAQREADGLPHDPIAAIEEFHSRFNSTDLPSGVTLPDLLYAVTEIRTAYTERERLAIKRRVELAIEDDNTELARIHLNALDDLGQRRLSLRQRILPARAFDLQNPPPIAEPIFSIGRASILTPGNLAVVGAQAKAGKSAFIGAMLASAMSSKGDTLGCISQNPKGHALIHFDTEQSPADHHNLVATALRRADVEEPPPWLRSYRIFDLPIPDRLTALEEELSFCARKFGGIHSVILDGVADYCVDPNDATEAFSLVARLHTLTGRYNTGLLAVLHHNPGTETGKTRGHLGSQLERKAESNLTIDKDADGISTIYTKNSRHAFIPKDSGPRFRWNDIEEMHTSCESAGEQKTRADADMLWAVFAEAFETKDAYRFSELREQVERIRRVKPSMAEKSIRTAKDSGIIRKDVTNLYRIAR